jgi:hypothetical protein
MRRTLLGGLFAISLVVPAVASATPLRDTAKEIGSPQGQAPLVRGHLGQLNQGDTEGGASLGNGMMGGNDPGRVNQPGRTPVDPSIPGPVNDVNPKTPPAKPVP